MLAYQLEGGGGQPEGRKGRRMMGGGRVGGVVGGDDDDTGGRVRPVTPEEAAAGLVVGSPVDDTAALGDGGDAGGAEAYGVDGAGASADEGSAAFFGVGAGAGAAARYEGLPAIAYAFEQRVIKAEDVVFCHHERAPAPGRCHSIFLVCDGHQGPGAARHVAEFVPRRLGRSLPRELPDWDNAAEVAVFSEAVRRAVSRAVVDADNEWTARRHVAGTTATAVIVSGWLVTVANVGDSSAALDDGGAGPAREATVSHRIQNNPSEQRRLRDGGALLAPLGFHLQGPAKPKEMGVGPLRLWPGGLCVSRSIGDMDAGPLVVPLPHIRQVS